MGVANQGVFGAWQKRVGNVVGRIVQGRNIYSIYQPQVSNPQTQAQQTNRSAFSVMAEFVSQSLAAIRVGFRNLDGYKKGSAYSSALGYNLTKAKAISGTYPNLEVNYNKVVVSEGGVDLPYDPSGTVADGELTVSWADNSGQGDALATDKAALFLFNTTQKKSVFAVTDSKRSDRTAKISVPTAWTGDTAVGYLFMVREDKGVNSMSTYVGSYTL